MEDHARFGSASLSQVSELLGGSEDELLAKAERLTASNAASRGWLTAAAVSALLAGVKPAKPLSEAEPLILEAFKQAQESVKTDWTSMPIPVLKNRLLQLSKRSFREMEYGSPNIWHFVTQFPHLLSTEGTRPVERVRLVDPAAIGSTVRDAPAALDPAGLGRIRQDLWRALFDFAAQEAFVWDEAKGRARPRFEKDGDELPLVPTLSADDMEDLRKEFIRLQEKVSVDDAKRLDDWVRRAGPTIALPRTYRALWNTHLKSHAANTLRAFFVAEGIDVPEDLVEQAGVESPELAGEVEKLRRAAHQYVDAMTGEELSRLSFEMAVVLRVPISSRRPQAK